MTFLYPLFQYLPQAIHFMLLCSKYLSEFLMTFYACALYSHVLSLFSTFLQMYYISFVLPLHVINESILKWMKSSLKKVYILVDGRKGRIFLFFDAIHDHIISMNDFLAWEYFVDSKFLGLKFVIFDFLEFGIVDKQSEFLRWNHSNYKIMVLKFLHPIIAGFFGFLATIIGSKYFNANNEYWQIVMGVGFFVLANYLLYKFKFNSYHLNGSTITTVLIFTSQITFIGLWKM